MKILFVVVEREVKMRLAPTKEEEEGDDVMECSVYGGVVSKEESRGKLSTTSLSSQALLQEKNLVCDESNRRQRINFCRREGVCQEWVGVCV